MASSLMNKIRDSTSSSDGPKKQNRRSSAIGLLHEEDEEVYQSNNTNKARPPAPLPSILDRMTPPTNILDRMSFGVNRAISPKREADGSSTTATTNTPSDSRNSIGGRIMKNLSPKGLSSNIKLRNQSKSPNNSSHEEKKARGSSSPFSSSSSPGNGRQNTTTNVASTMLSNIKVPTIQLPKNVQRSRSKSPKNSSSSHKEKEKAIDCSPLSPGNGRKNNPTTNVASKMLSSMKVPTLQIPSVQLPSVQMIPTFGGGAKSSSSNNPSDHSPRRRNNSGNKLSLGGLGGLVGGLGGGGGSGHQDNKDDLWASISSEKGFSESFVFREEDNDDEDKGDGEHRKDNFDSSDDDDLGSDVESIDDDDKEKIDYNHINVNQYSVLEESTIFDGQGIQFEPGYLKATAMTSCLQFDPANIGIENDHITKKALQPSPETSFEEDFVQ